MHTYQFKKKAETRGFQPKNTCFPKIKELLNFNIVDSRLTKVRQLVDLGIDQEIDLFAAISQVDAPLISLDTPEFV